MAALKKEESYRPPPAGSIDIAAANISSPPKPPGIGFRRRNVSPNGTRYWWRYEWPNGYTSDAQSPVSVTDSLVRSGAATELATHNPGSEFETDGAGNPRKEGGRGFAYEQGASKSKSVSTHGILFPNAAWRRKAAPFA
jgi:hypothetical protein